MAIHADASESLQAVCLFVLLGKEESTASQRSEIGANRKGLDTSLWMKSISGRNLPCRINIWIIMLVDLA
jgi:hypothetical protein